jgi:O-antigen ligase
MQKIALPSTLNTPTLHAFASAMVIALPVMFLFGRGGSDALMSTATALFIAHSFVSKDFSWLKERWIKLALALWVYVCIRSYWTDYPAESFARSISWIRFPLFAAALGAWILKDLEVRKWLIYSLYVCVLFIIFDSLIQFFVGADVFAKPYLIDEEKIRLTGPFGAPIVGIMLMTLTFPVCLSAMIAQNGTPRNLKRFVLGAALCLLSLGTVLLSGERTALILCLLGFGMMFLVIPIRLLYKASMLATGVMVLGILLFTNPLVMQRQIHSLTSTISDFGNSAYGEIWGSAWRIFEKNPTFGVGVLQFRNECPKEAYGSTETTALRCNYHPHNLYLEWLAETGLVGFSIFIGMIGLLFGRWAKAYPALKTHPVYLGLLITLCIRFFPFAPLTSFFISWFAIPLWLFIGWLNALTPTLSSENKAT